VSSPAPFNFSNPVLRGKPELFDTYWQKALNSLINVIGRILGVALGGTGADNTIQTWTPTHSGNVNCTSTTEEAMYFRIGSVVYFAGQFQVNPVILGTTAFEMSLPIPSNFTATRQAGGSAFARTIASQGANIRANVANNTLAVEFIAVDVANCDMGFSGSYLIV